MQQKVQNLQKKSRKEISKDVFSYLHQIIKMG